MDNNGLDAGVGAYDEQLQVKVKELEALFIWGKIVVIPLANSKLADIHIHLVSALFRQELTVVAVDPLGWVLQEIEDRKDSHPEAFWLWCFSCGHVQIGHDEYRRQLGKEDAFWKCPKCDNFADFDNDAYEKVFYPEEN